jgi:hypothetical protein
MQLPASYTIWQTASAQICNLLHRGVSILLWTQADDVNVG